KVAVNKASPYVGHANLEARKSDNQLEKIRKAKSAIRVLSHPARSAFGTLAEFAQKEKRLRKGKFVEILPHISKDIESLSSDVQGVPEDAGEVQGASPSEPETV